MKRINLHWTTIVTEKVMLAVIGGLTVVAAGVDTVSYTHLTLPTILRV